MLFPLPLTPFERYYLADDRPEYPTTFPAELRFSGRMEREPFLRALRQAVARHPLLDARVDDDDAAPQWVSSGQPEPNVDWADESVAIGPAGGEYLDVRRGAGLRVWVRTSAAATRVLLQLHHACCDGLAVFQLIEDLLVLYAAAVAGSDGTDALGRPAVERLRDRAAVDTGGAAPPSLAVAIRDVWVTARVWSKILFGRCAVLAAPAHSGDASAPAPGRGPEGFLAFETHVMDRDASRRYCEAAAASGATVNDLLIRDMLLALGEWNRRQGHARLGPCRVNVPVYVRDRSSADIPASNGIGFSFVTLDPDRFASRRALLTAVKTQMEQIKKWRLALYFLGGLAAASRVKGAVPWALGRKRPLATLVLSNLGRVLARTPLERREGRLVCGNVVLERVTGVPPIRPLTRAAIAVVEYAGQQAISLRCDPHLFGASDTRALLDAYVEQLHETLRGAT